MSFGLVAAAGATIVGGMISADAAGDAADTQARGTAEAARLQAEGLDKQLALQREQFDRTLQLQQPGIQAGDAARNRLLYMMGLSPTGFNTPTAAFTGGAAPSAPQTREQIRQQLQSQYTTGTTGTQPTMQERPDLYTAGGGIEQGGTNAPVYIGPQVTNTQTVDQQALNAAVERQYAQQQQQTEATTAAQQQADAAAAARAAADPNYGALTRGFTGADADRDAIFNYQSGLVNAARDRASNLNNDPLYERSLVDAARARVNDPSSDPLTQRMQPAVDAALAGSTSIENDPLYQQQKPLVQQAIQRASNFTTAPGYTFRLAEGMKGVENSAAARGGLLSGAALKATQRYGQDFASNEYDRWFQQSAADRGYVAGVGNDAFNRLNTNRNFVSGQNDAQFGRMNTDRNYITSQNEGAYSRANTDRNYIAAQGDAVFNRFNTNQTNAFNRLSGLAGAGQTATNNVQTAGQTYAQGAGAAYGNYANNVGNITTNGANASAAAGIAGSNAINSGIQGGINAYQQNRFLSTLQNNRGGTYTNSPYDYTRESWY